MQCWHTKNSVLKEKIMKVNNLLNQTFGRLTVLSKAANPMTRKGDTAAYWNCLCSCGKICVIRGYSLKTGKTQSCGCLKLEAPHLIPFSLPKYPSIEVAARKAWRSRYTDLPFDIFCELAQKSCFYCGELYCLQRESIRKDPAIFYYNTLDRIDSSLGHIVGNVVPSCLICNCAKLDRSMSEFMDHISRLVKNINRISPEDYRKQTTLVDSSILLKPEKYLKYSLITHVRCAFYPTYTDGDISIDLFYQLASSNCYYCGIQPQNRRSKDNLFLYNGLDRVDSNFTHNYDNVIPCCKYCNFAKSDLTMQEFDDWIIRLKNHQATNKLEIISTPF
jgi:hypothetical protein